MVSSSATKNSRLLNPWALAVVAVAVGGLLWATFQREEVFQPDGREPDAVSANYAELLLAAHPDDDHLRLQLVDLLIHLGDYEKARKHLEAWPKPVPEVQAYYRLELDALVAASTNDLIAQQALVERLQSFDHRKLQLPQLQNLAKLALTLQAPAFAASVYEEIADREPKLAPGGPLGRTRLLEMLSYLSTELHIAFKPYYHGASDAEKVVAGEAVAQRLDAIEEHMHELYLFGPRFTVADAYLFVMLRWARAFGVRMSPEMHAYFDRVAERETVRQALAEEGLE